jgi:hypothetical protein
MFGAWAAHFGRLPPRVGQPRAFLRGRRCRRWSRSRREHCLGATPGRGPTPHSRRNAPKARRQSTSGLPFYSPIYSWAPCTKAGRFWYRSCCPWRSASRLCRRNRGGQLDLGPLCPDRHGGPDRPGCEKRDSDRRVCQGTARARHPIIAGCRRWRPRPVPPGDDDLLRLHPRPLTRW